MNSKIITLVSVTVIGILIYHWYDNNVKNSKAEKLIKFGLS